jgi:phosphatidylinositol-3-phosphatase
MIRTACALLAICGVVLTTACAATAPVDHTARVAMASSAPAGLPRPDHVLIVVLENRGRHEVAREAPYLASLVGVGAELMNMHARTRPSQPNYLALFSGDVQGVSDDSCPHTFDAPNLGTELAAAGLSFAGYSEDLPESGFAGCRAGGYARERSPWASFSTVPSTAHQPTSAMPADHRALPTVSFLVPNLCHGMRDCSVTEGDSWLRENIDGYAQWARTHNSLLVVTFDESKPSRRGDNHIATLLVGEMVRPGAYYERADHYRLLRTIEDMYGLTPLGHSATTTALRSMWQSPAP